MPGRITWFKWMHTKQKKDIYFNHKDHLAKQMNSSISFLTLNTPYVLLSLETHYLSSWLMIQHWNNKMVETTTEGTKINLLTTSYGFSKIIFSLTHIFPNSFSCTDLIFLTAMQINIIPLPVIMNRKIKKPPVKLIFQRSQ